jgi:predicted CXXCH cytochrome family protein
MRAPRLPIGVVAAIVAVMAAFISSGPRAGEPPADAPAHTAAQPANLCTLCHAEIRVQFDRGVHKTEGIACVSCHGGNPAASTVEAAHRGGFRGEPRRRDIPALCAGCHADVARMRPYNLPSDQFALYQTSQHGTRLAKGDDTVAVCTDCHGVHDIRRPDDPQSPVFRRNVPATCGRCHGDAAQLKRYGRSDNPFADYVVGVHGVAFLEKANNAAPECTRCHSSHGATPPGIGDVEKVCGQCHATTRTWFLAGPHKTAMDAAGLQECATCHHNHRTPPATVEMLDTVCLQCHDAGSEQVRLAATMKTMFTEAAAEIDRAERLVGEASRIPLYVEDYKARLQDARTALMESFPVMHAVDTAQVEPHTRRARSIAREVGDEIEEKFAGRWWRNVGLALFWFYLLLTATILVRARRRAIAEGRR